MLRHSVIGAVYDLVAYRKPVTPQIRNELREHGLSLQQWNIFHSDEIGLNFFDEASELVQQIPSLVGRTGFSAAIRREGLTRSAPCQQRKRSATQNLGEIRTRNVVDRFQKKVSAVVCSKWGFTRRI